MSKIRIVAEPYRNNFISALNEIAIEEIPPEMRMYQKKFWRGRQAAIELEIPMLPLKDYEVDDMNELIKQNEDLYKKPTRCRYKNLKKTPLDYKQNSKLLWRRYGILSTLD